MGWMTKRKKVGWKWKKRKSGKGRDEKERNPANKEQRQRQGTAMSHTLWHTSSAEDAANARQNAGTRTWKLDPFANGFWHCAAVEPATGMVTEDKRPMAIGLEGMEQPPEHCGEQAWKALWVTKPMGRNCQEARGPVAVLFFVRKEELVQEIIFSFPIVTDSHDKVLGTWLTLHCNGQSLVLFGASDGQHPTNRKETT